MAKKRTIQYVINKETGEEIKVDELFTTATVSHEIRKEYSLTSEKKYECVLCGQGLVLSKSKYDKFHFRHLQNSDYCDLLSNEDVQDEYQAISFKHQIWHRKLTNKLIVTLGKTTEVSDVKSKHPIRDYYQTFRPDLYFKYKGKEIAIYIQAYDLSYRYMLKLNNFYKTQGVYLLWVLGDTDAIGYRVKKDLKYLDSHHNLFEYSDLTSTFMLKCDYKDVFINRSKKEIHSKWKTKKIGLDDLSFDEESVEIFYYNYEKETEQKNKELEQLLINIEEKKQQTIEVRRKEWWDKWLNQFPESWRKYPNPNDKIRATCAEVHTSSGVILRFEYKGTDRNILELEQPNEKAIWIVNTECFKDDIKRQSIVKQQLRTVDQRVRKEKKDFSEKLSNYEMDKKDIESPIQENRKEIEKLKEEKITIENASTVISIEKQLKRFIKNRYKDVQTEDKEFLYDLESKLCNLYNNQLQEIFKEWKRTNAEEIENDFDKIKIEILKFIISWYDDIIEEIDSDIKKCLDKNIELEDMLLVTNSSITNHKKERDPYSFSYEQKIKIERSGIMKKYKGQYSYRLDLHYTIRVIWLKMVQSYVLFDMYDGNLCKRERNELKQISIKNFITKYSKE